MKATFALLTDQKTYNLVRKLCWEAHYNHKTGLKAARLEPHVSLKQPFEVKDLNTLAVYMEELAGSIPPFKIHVTGLEAVPTTIGNFKTGILWFDLEQSETLKELHKRLNKELKDRFGPTPADHDGDLYHFHMTVAIGDQPYPIYHAIIDSHPPQVYDFRFETSELAMFIYNQDFHLGSGYMTYKKHLLGRK